MGESFNGGIHHRLVVTFVSFPPRVFLAAMEKVVAHAHRGQHQSCACCFPSLSTWEVGGVFIVNGLTVHKDFLHGRTRNQDMPNISRDPLT